MQGVRDRIINEVILTLVGHALQRPVNMGGVPRRCHLTNATVTAPLGAYLCVERINYLLEYN